MEAVNKGANACGGSVTGYPNLPDVPPGEVAQVAQARGLLSLSGACSYLAGLAPDLQLDPVGLAGLVRHGLGPEAIRVGDFTLFHPADLLEWSQWLRASWSTFVG
jgi:hypothetical protein